MTLQEMEALPPDQTVYSGNARRIVRLRPRVIMKVSKNAHAEVEAHWFAQEHAGVPIPRLLLPLDATAPMPTPWLFCMEECKGVSLETVIDDMSTSQLDHVALQLRRIVDNIASVKSESREFLGSVTGGPFRNMFFPEHLSPDSAFDTVHDFLDAFRQILLFFCTESFTEDFLAQFPESAQVVFTHGDLLPRNIMVEGTTITGVLDWATAGFYPSYWEYSRMHDPHSMTPGWDYVLSQVFPEERRIKEIRAVRELMDMIQFNC
jgi:aminoglycoside phosphotransferase (APT) family kinase protein